MVFLKCLEHLRSYFVALWGSIKFPQGDVMLGEGEQLFRSDHKHDSA